MTHMHATSAKLVIIGAGPPDYIIMWFQVFMIMFLVSAPDCVDYTMMEH